jgi:hypothetical protein
MGVAWVQERFPCRHEGSLESLFNGGNKTDLGDGKAVGKRMQFLVA